MLIHISKVTYIDQSDVIDSNFTPLFGRVMAYLIMSFFSSFFFFLFLLFFSCYLVSFSPWVPLLFIGLVNAKIEFCFS